MTTEQKIERLWDIHQIKNLMGKYALLANAHMHMETVNLFDLSRDDVWMECGGMGVYKKPEGIRKFFYDWHLSMEGDGKGMLIEHLLTSEVIEVAEDGQTAKGVWISPGIETRMVHPDKKLEAVWIWGKYRVEFIKDKNGDWKFWNFTITNDFMCDYHHSWVETEKEFAKLIYHNGMPKPDEPNTFEDGYSRNTVGQLVPMIPEPYKTYGESS